MTLCVCVNILLGQDVWRRRTSVVVMLGQVQPNSLELVACANAFNHGNTYVCIEYLVIGRLERQIAVW